MKWNRLYETAHDQSERGRDELTRVLNHARRTMTRCQSEQSSYRSVFSTSRPLPVARNSSHSPFPYGHERSVRNDTFQNSGDIPQKFRELRDMSRGFWNYRSPDSWMIKTESISGKRKKTRCPGTITDVRTSSIAWRGQCKKMDRVGRDSHI